MGKVEILDTIYYITLLHSSNFNDLEPPHSFPFLGGLMTTSYHLKHESPFIFIFSELSK